MFWCDFTLDLPKISAKEPFNPPLLPPPPTPSLHPSITDSMLVAPVSASSPPLPSPPPFSLADLSSRSRDPSPEITCLSTMSPGTPSLFKRSGENRLCFNYNPFRNGTRSRVGRNHAWWFETSKNKSEIIMRSRQDFLFLILTILERGRIWKFIGFISIIGNKIVRL